MKMDGLLDGNLLHWSHDPDLRTITLWGFKDQGKLEIVIPDEMIDSMHKLAYPKREPECICMQRKQEFMRSSVKFTCPKHGEMEIDQRELARHAP